METVLVTGAAGFIGFHLSKKLCDEGYKVIGIDNLNEYYDVDLKKARIKILQDLSSFTFYKVDLNELALGDVFKSCKIDVVVNLAAQAGVRHSIECPDDYVSSNISGFVKLIELSKQYKIRHFMYASSASVYGANKSIPFKTTDSTDHPISLYAASKKSNELIAHSYSALFGLPVTGLRFFSVYGPYGRPDMALFKFTKAILEEKPMDVYNHGKMKRSFTFVDDVCESVFRLINKIPRNNDNWDGINMNPSSSFAPYRVFNVGNDQVVDLVYYIGLIENRLNKKAIMNYLPMQPGDISESKPHLQDLVDEIDYRPSTSIEKGINAFIDWYREYYKI
ncbi:NAD-dependent epimerase/dehydratase family protein [Reichenbachiella agarivorans]|uniref:NAD-dependent epimerase/dehydratase family protein n=1 Tax=Reichenbachiella agarivorans TaxID=2979464 RepID=A0ABY6CSR4_9BACT|nr:NAD-dependent epimerase/dehydratase family protein [Reichenbachiella agarivorans]UXP33567.1 NAD-dependent epimerase/dehydratase family protein [Reichenbachiella agarivorans]